MTKLKCFVGLECADKKNYIACFTPEAKESSYSFQEFCSDTKEISGKIDIVNINGREGQLNLKKERNYGWENIEIVSG